MGLKLVNFISAVIIIAITMFYMNKEGAPQWALIMAFNTLIFMWLINYRETE